MFTTNFQSYTDTYTYDEQKYINNCKLIKYNVKNKIITNNLSSTKYYTISGYFDKVYFDDLFNSIEIENDEAYNNTLNYISKYIYRSFDNKNVYFNIIVNNNDNNINMISLTSEQFKSYYTVIKEIQCANSKRKKQIKLIDLVNTLYNKDNQITQIINIYNYPVLSIVDNIKYVNIGKTLDIYNDFQTNKLKHFKDYDYHIQKQIFLFFDHIKTVLCNDEEEIFKAYKQFILACVLGIKVQYSIINSGGQGTGKSLMVTALSKKFMDSDVVAFVPNKEALLKYNRDFIKNKNLIIIEEGGGSEYTAKTNHDFENKLKDLITGDIINVDAKFKDYEIVKNNVNIIINTNSSSPVKVSMDDRRYLFPDINLKLINKENPEVKDRIYSLLFLTPNIYTDDEYKKLLRSCMFSYALENFDKTYINYKPDDTIHKTLIKSSIKVDDFTLFISYLVDNKINIVSNKTNYITLDDIYKIYTNQYLCSFDEDIRTFKQEQNKTKTLLYLKSGFDNLISLTMQGSYKKYPAKCLGSYKIYLSTLERYLNFKKIIKLNETIESTANIDNININKEEEINAKINETEKIFKEHENALLEKINDLEIKQQDYINQISALTVELTNYKAINSDLQIKLTKSLNTKSSIYKSYTQEVLLD